MHHWMRDYLFLFLQVPIICESFLPELSHILLDSENPEAQRHAAGVIRNLAAGEHSRVRYKFQYIHVLNSLKVASGIVTWDPPIPLHSQIKVSHGKIQFS